MAIARVRKSERFLPALVLAAVPSILVSLAVALYLIHVPQSRQSELIWSTLAPFMAAGFSPETALEIRDALLRVSPARHGLLLFPFFAVFFLELLRSPKSQSFDFVSPRTRREQSRRFLRAVGLCAIAFELGLPLYVWAAQPAWRLWSLFLMLFTGTYGMDYAGLQPALLKAAPAWPMLWETPLGMLLAGHTALISVLAQTVVLGALYRVLDSWLTRVMSALFVLVAGCLLMSALFKGIEVLLGISLLLALTALAAWFAAVWYLYFRLQRKGKTAYVEFPESSTG